MLAGVSSFVATVTGKVVLGGAVAAASVGGLHAADVVDVPGLPDRPAVEQQGDSQEIDTQNEGTPDGAGDFGTRVSEDASDPNDPGVDGQQIADEAGDFGTSTAKDNADGTPGAEHIPDDPTSTGPPETSGAENDPTGNSTSGTENVPEDIEPGAQAPADAGSQASSGAGSERRSDQP